MALLATQEDLERPHDLLLRTVGAQGGQVGTVGAGGRGKGPTGVTTREGVKNGIILFLVFVICDEKVYI